ncbi:MAG TPA: lysylphosphatidylglycerol synthase domain-containing protein [Pyrinomonadaceae bacterium]|nr:lysylphosphatidylglycerol synthase domain-containing protein [Pyrinomonadaceae bacterium]
MDTSPHKNNKAADNDGGKKGNAWLPVAGFVFGIAVLVFLVYFVGLETIYEPLAKIGWGFFLIVALNGIRHYLRAICMYIAVPESDRGFSVRNAFSARLAGETINTIAFTGPVLGDAAKAAMLNRKVTVEHSATAVIIDEIIYYITSLMLILGGAIVVLYAYGNGLALNLILFGLILFGAVILFGTWWVVRKNFKPVSWVVKKAGDRWFVPGSLVRKQDEILEIESNVIEFQEKRRKAFFIVLSIIVATHVLSVLEAYWAMQMLGLSVTMVSAFIIESLTKAVNFIFFLIPGTIGAYEGGNSLILQSLGFTAGAGVALALVRRGGILFWTLIGGIILLWKGAKTSVEQLKETGDEGT